MRYYDDSSLLVEPPLDSMARSPGIDSDTRSPATGAVQTRPQTEAEVASFSIGICGSGHSAETLRRLMRVIQSEEFPAQFSLRRVIIVASDTSEATTDFLLKLVDDDKRIM